MNIREDLKLAIRSMNSNRIRTVLSVIGIMIGVISIVVVFSAGEGLRSLVEDQVESFGTNIIEVEIKVPSSKQGASGDTEGSMALAQGVEITTLNLRDLEDINNLSNVRASYGAVLNQEQISYGNERKKAFLLGTNSSYIDIDKSEIETGRFFTDLEDKSLAQVVVLGAKIKDEIFGDSEAVGKYITLHRTKFKVVGVLKEKGAVMTMDFDDFAYVPIRTLQKRMMGIDHLMYTVHQLNDMSLADDTAEQIRFILRANHNISDPARDDFRVTTMEEMMSMLDIITNSITFLLLAIVIISLIVGGVGVLNIMYVIVAQRTSEIGLRKAVGARASDIMSQFLTESVLITLWGGLLGSIMGVILSWLLSVAINYFGLDWQWTVPLKAFLVVGIFSFVFGIFFGVYPARKAARMDPVAALRKE